ncbi:hypothetical protein PF005_g13584 [Phytophthora fragariae]|uniref:DDE-1 domain-containing protein n=1 Tax=Phytophthora fragariae TaxID=53985 RepID=A0A6A3EN62_9STRA|nr:hypothetical protein PF009_g16194 [Phytophthora fragariae]KAE9001592.1 hypothetical protein PF011_g13675 [Phytophthora fragariae]KAE9100761.1 hypothetical protein PF010_g14696 [Phytophthora fragariae]KAE9101018.1 hypothetical protein PF007_g15307 [Phytophthora fragariae]KAE9136186.1 hypothetical protein PF006_g14445 [Phytophthora fragariae]
MCAGWMWLQNLLDVNVLYIIGSLPCKDTEFERFYAFYECDFPFKVFMPGNVRNMIINFKRDYLDNFIRLNRGSQNWQMVQKIW